LLLLLLLLLLPPKFPHFGALVFEETDGQILPTDFIRPIVLAAQV
jgi:hypothetical protein